MANEGIGLAAQPSDEFRRSEIAAERYDRFDFFPGTGVLQAGGAGAGDGNVLAGANNIPTVAFLAGSTTRYSWLMPVRKDFRKHSLRIVIWYTAAVGSTNTFTLAVNPMTYLRTGLASAFASFPETITPAGPGTAFDVLSTEVSCADDSVRVQDHMGTRLALIRNTGDANANTLHVLKVEVTFEPA